MSTIAAQIMDALETLLEDDRDPEDIDPDTDPPLQPPLQRDRVFTLAKKDLDIRVLNWGPDGPRVQEPGRPPTRRDDPVDRRTLAALLMIRCKATETLRASEVADSCVAWAVSKVCGPVRAGSTLAGLADRVYLGGREPKLGPGDPATILVVLELLVDYWNLVTDAERAT